MTPLTKMSGKLNGVKFAYFLQFIFSSYHSQLNPRNQVNLSVNKQNFIWRVGANRYFKI